MRKSGVKFAGLAKIRYICGRKPTNQDPYFMDNRNIFSGDGDQSLYAFRIYKLLKKGDWFSYYNIAEACCPRTKFNWSIEKISGVKGYTLMKKAFKSVRDALKAHIGSDLIEERGTKRTKEYHYKGADDDPLRFLVDTNIKKTTEEYMEFCHDSAGFFPIAWLEHYMKQTLELYEINSQKKK